ncbi:MAG TPA: S8 family serine peptidase [Acidimicrobiales bacterium]|nr:S8 family serine peptidase [Acidimicrobiales bacterium]
MRAVTWKRSVSLAVVTALFVASAAAQAAPSGASPDRVRQAPAGEEGPDEVRTNSDEAMAKLAPELREQVESGSTDRIPVFATTEGDASAATAHLDNAHVAQSGGAGLVVGTIAVPALPKLAGAAGVVAVGPISFEKDGEPLGIPDPEVGKQPDLATQRQALDALRSKEVPFPQAPALAGSHFDELRELGVLDAKTHNFADAWAAGYTGEGSTVGVLDGGTDFGHPDLIGTWQVWSGLTGARAGWNGWPKAFDPFGVLQWLAAPNQIDQGLSWYVTTKAAGCPAGRPPNSTCTVNFATKTGPSRNFAAPAGTNTHTYGFRSAWTKSGTVHLGSHPDDHLLQLYGERPAFLVTDPNTAGVYDTVYVDLDNDYRFDDEKPVTKASPASYRDVNGDGFTDMSGGLLYYVSDGATPIPGGLDAFGVLDNSFGPGELLAWSGDFDPAIEGHGTLTASNVVAQGVVNGLAPKFSDLPTASHTYPGAVIGGAPDARLAPFGDIYFSFAFSTQLGYFLSTRRGIDVTSNSYGSSNVDNDGWDAASQEADVIHSNQRTTPLFSTGNGAPGFGTVTPPSPAAAIRVGASTQFGGTGWDSVDRISQVTDDDVMVWSNRGPGANATPGVDVVADGAFSSGDTTLNTILDGRNAWVTWGGTSRSTPVAVSATALVYEARRKAGGAITPGFYNTAKNILKSSAKDFGYDSMIQGAGSVDAGKATLTAAGGRATVSPNEWRVGDYRGEEFPVFAHTIAPGGSDSQTFTLNGPGTWQVSDRQMVRTDSEDFSFSSSQVANEANFNFNAPDYLMDLSDRVGAHPDADLMVVRVNYPREQFDGNVDYDEDQDWRLLTYNWTDINGNGRLWADRDGDGAVDHRDLKTVSNVDGTADIDFKHSEMEKGEYVRFMYHRPGANTLMSFVRDPAERMADGLFLGLQHTTHNNAVPVTDFDVQIDWYSNADWDWVSTPASASGSFDASINVPADTPYGMYSGAIVLTNGTDSMVVPVEVAVAATVPQGPDGSIAGALTFGGGDVAEAQADLLYNNGSVFGANDWTWRAESGDWRFFYMDVPQEPPPGSLFLTQTSWDGTAPFTDIDTLLMGRSENSFQVVGDQVFGAPYIIDTVGGSPNTNTGAGVWRFDTASGGSSDVVTAPAQEGLHALALHQVGWQGDEFHTPFTATVGSASVTPSPAEVSTAADTGSFDVTFESGLDLDGLTAEAFGLSQPAVTTETAQQDNPDDATTASIKRNVTLDHASRLTVTTALANNDIDLFVVFDANGDGAFTPNEVVGSSTTPTGDESVELVAPPDGNYQVWVHGFGVTGSPTFPLTIDPIQGNDLTVSGLPDGPVPANTPVTLTVDFAHQMTAGQDYFGELLLGPPSAPTALTVPIRISRT